MNERGDAFKNHVVEGEEAINKLLFMVILNLYGFVLILFFCF